MDRMTLKEEIRQHFDCRDYLRKSSGCSLYICPSCGSGSRQHKTGAVKYYPDTQRWHCHRCKTLGDIFTIYELEHGVDFNVALWALAEQLGTSVEPHSTKPARKCPPAPSPVQSGSARRICLITSRRVVPDCMTLPLFPSYLLVESISRRQRLMALASAPKQTRQEVTAAARELPSRQTVSTTSHAVSTRMHNRGAGR